jgi:hypothetical protein
VEKHTAKRLPQSRRLAGAKDDDTLFLTVGRQYIKFNI